MPSTCGPARSCLRPPAPVDGRASGRPDPARGLHRLRRPLHPPRGRRRDDRARDGRLLDDPPVLVRGGRNVRSERGGLSTECSPRERSRWSSSGPAGLDEAGPTPAALGRRGAWGDYAPTAPRALSRAGPSSWRGDAPDLGTSPASRAGRDAWPAASSSTLLLAVAMVAAGQLQAPARPRGGGTPPADPHPRGNGGASPRVSLRDLGADAPGAGLPAPAARR